jgi:hypothetical protein
MIDWLFTVLRPAQEFFIYVEINWLFTVFTSRSRIFHLIWRRHHCQWRAAKFRLMLGAQGLWAGRDLYRATPAVTRDLGFSGLIRRTAPFSRFLRYTRGCGGPILTRILTGDVTKVKCKNSKQANKSSLKIHRIVHWLFTVLRPPQETSPRWCYKIYPYARRSCKCIVSEVYSSCLVIKKSWFELYSCR